MDSYIHFPVNRLIQKLVYSKLMLALANMLCANHKVS